MPPRTLRSTAIALLLSFGCSGSDAASTSAGGSGGSAAAGGAGGAGGEGGQGDDCGCKTTEICDSGNCYAKQRVFASVIQIGDGGSASLGAFGFAGVPPGTSAIEDGDCVIRSGPISADPYGTPLDAGSATLTIGDGAPIPFPPFEDGRATIELGIASVAGNTTIDPAGNEPITMTWSGGSDIPPSSITFTTAPPVQLLDIDPMVPGEPWELAWLPPSPELATINFDAADGSLVTCFANGSSVVVPGTVTALVDPIAVAGGDLLVRLALRPAIVEDMIGDGIVVSGIAIRLVGVDVPPP